MTFTFSISSTSKVSIPFFSNFCILLVFLRFQFRLFYFRHCWAITFVLFSSSSSVIKSLVRITNLTVAFLLPNIQSIQSSVHDFSRFTLAGRLFLLFGRCVPVHLTLSFDLTQDQSLIPKSEGKQTNGQISPTASKHFAPSRVIRFPYLTWNTHLVWFEHYLNSTKVEEFLP